MAGISMCINDLCPLRGECYRQTATTSDWETYMTFSFEYREDGVPICDDFMEVKKNGS